MQYRSCKEKQRVSWLSPGFYGQRSGCEAYALEMHESKHAHTRSSTSDCNAGVCSAILPFSTPEQTITSHASLKQLEQTHVPAAPAPPG